MEKGLYAAPMGIGSMGTPGADDALEIEIEDPESVTMSDGSMEITLMSPLSEWLS